MITNHEIAKRLETLADLLEFTGANPFRTRAYRAGARAIAQLPHPIAKLVEDETDLVQYEGIGKSVAEKCVELVNTGQISQLDEILKDIPASVLDMLNVPKLGPKKAAKLYHELGIQNLEQLKTACEEKKVRELDGFGAKSEQAILDGIAIAMSARERMLWSEADAYVAKLREYFADCKAVQRLEFAGSYRRGLETVGDLDMLVVSNDHEKVMDRFAAYPEIEAVIVRGPTKMSVRLHNGPNVDLRVVPRQSFGAALQYFTGSKEHNISLRKMAGEMGLKINEWGVFRDADPDKSIAGVEEADIYAAMGLQCMPPELRENRKELEWAAHGTLPTLVELKDMIGDLHMHTTATDGSASIEEMASAAQALGYQYIAITDHSKRVTVANGLNADRLLRQWEEIDDLNEWMPEGFVILKGIECDILEDGRLDLSDDVLAEADWVIASVHFGQNQDEAQITSRIVGALENPNVSIIAHPTGRLLNQRDPYAVDIEAVMAAAQKHHKLLELNASPRRLDLSDVHLMAASEFGIPIAINTDAHSPKGLASMRFGITQARRAALTRLQVANSQPWSTIRRYLDAGVWSPV